MENSGKEDRKKEGGKSNGFNNHEQTSSHF